MKRTWIASGVVAALLAGTLLVAGTVLADDTTQATPGAGLRFRGAVGQNGPADGTGTYGPGMRGGRGQGAGGQSMMGGGPGMMAGGRGMMAGGRGGMMGGGLGIVCNGQNYDPATMLTNAEARLAQQKAVLLDLEARLASATDEQVKALLTARIEMHKIQIGLAEAQIPVIKTLPAAWLDGAIALVKSEIAYFERATATDANNTTMIANHLAAAKQRLTLLEAEKAKEAASKS